MYSCQFLALFLYFSQKLSFFILFFSFCKYTCLCPLFIFLSIPSKLFLCSPIPSSRLDVIDVIVWHWGCVDCSVCWGRTLHVALTQGNTSHAPGGLPGMLLNNEVHSLTSPSKATLPRCPFQQAAALVQQSAERKEKHNHAFCPRQSPRPPTLHMKDKKGHYLSLMPSYDHNYHTQNPLPYFL